MERIVCIAVALFALSGCGGASEPPISADGSNASVVRVIDGDTIVARIGGAEERVRLIGIDTPESVIPGETPECFGPEASARLAELLPERATIRLERDVEARDRFDRLLAYIYRGGTFINLKMTEDGFAATLEIAPNVAHTDAFAASASRARAASLGLWGAC